MSSILDIWKSNPDFLTDKSIQQILAMCGDGALREANKTSVEFRDFLAVQPSERLAAFARECLESSFAQSGFALQDAVNQMGVRLGFTVTNGRYRGTKGEPGFDGIWAAADGYRFIAEIKTTDAYRINLDTIASYRSTLVASGMLQEGSSSVLIIVGRQDTGDLEAQIRGSRHAWDVRLISTDALIRLMWLKENLSDWATSLKINEILKPVEYTRVDPIIDLIFTTSDDLKEEHQEATQPQPDGQQTAETKMDITALRADAIQRLEKHFGMPLVKAGRVFYKSADGNIGIVCLASQPYEHPSYVDYWFGFKPGQSKFVSELSKAFVAFACGVRDQIVLFPAAEFLPLLEGMSETENTHWHVQLFWKNGSIFLDQPRKGQRLDVTKYLIPKA